MNYVTVKQRCVTCGKIGTFDVDAGKVTELSIWDKPDGWILKGSCSQKCYDNAETDEEDE